MRAQADACVANGAAYGFGFGIVTSGGVEHFSDTGELYAALERIAMAASPGS